jgi:hypothetical protein
MTPPGQDAHQGGPVRGNASEGPAASVLAGYRTLYTLVPGSVALAVPMAEWRNPVLGFAAH